jgi:formylglycine-generating enzyme required for sulfatase activity
VYKGQSGPADITSAGGLSAYGTMGQGGNAWEWNETAYDGINNIVGESREVRGGSWDEGTTVQVASSRSGVAALSATLFNGFRVASVPEPSALSLLAVGLGALAMMRRRRS